MEGRSVEEEEGKGSGESRQYHEKIDMCERSRSWTASSVGRGPGGGEEKRIGEIVWGGERWKWCGAEKGVCVCECVGICTRWESEWGCVGGKEEWGKMGLDVGAYVGGVLLERVENGGMVFQNREKENIGGGDEEREWWCYYYCIFTVFFLKPWCDGQESFDREAHELAQSGCRWCHVDESKWPV